MAGSMKAIRSRIRSVEGTMQITKAMELVASSKLRHARQRAEQSRPCFETLYATLTDIATRSGPDSPYLKPRSPKRICYVVIAGDRGLAGGYNANLFRLYEAERAARPECQVCVLPIGKRTAEYFERRGASILTRSFVEAGEQSVSDCFEAARLLCDAYLAGEIDGICIVYTRFVSMLSQQPAALQALPFVPGDAREGAAPVSVLYEPDSETVFNAIIPEYVAGMLYGALCESVASEQAARRTAMDAASKNAAEIIETLNLHYNRARQAAITQELTEIVAGANANEM